MAFVMALVMALVMAPVLSAIALLVVVPVTGRVVVIIFCGLGGLGGLAVRVSPVSAGMGVHGTAVVGVGILPLLDVIDTRGGRRRGVHALGPMAMYNATTENNDGSQTDAGKKQTTQHCGFPQLRLSPATSGRRDRAHVGPFATVVWRFGPVRTVIVSAVPVREGAAIKSAVALVEENTTRRPR